MNLLMQALQKAERAKQNTLPDEELEKPSEAYDQVLSLAPQESMPAPAQAATAPPDYNLRLEPLPGDFDASAETAQPATPPPPQSQAQPPRSGAQATPRPKNRAAPPPRAALTVDPATLRLSVLIGILLLVIAGFGYWFWRATSGPGIGASLPPVAMPLTDAPGATAAGPLLLAAPNDAGASAEPPASAAPSALEQQQAALIAAQAETLARLQQQLQQPQQQPRATAPAPVPIAAQDDGPIKVLRSNNAPRIDPGLQGAYQAYAAGDIEAARSRYDSVLRQDANNRDALLGMAAIALRQRQPQQAAALYVRLLELDPNDGDAMAGLVGLRQTSQGPDGQGEARLKAILQRVPENGPALFALGNLYASQQRWNEAQQQFFLAYSVTPGNPDYAFNLAIGLDRLNQGKLAVTYYQRALLLAQTTPGSFDAAAVANRLRELGAPVAAPTAQAAQ